MKKRTVKRPDKELSEIISLVTELEEGMILPEQFSQLEEILSTNPKAREHYAEIIQLYADLEFMFKQNAATVPILMDN